MFEQIVKLFADMKITITTQGVSESAEPQLEQLNQQFVSLLEDWRMLQPDEQNSQTTTFINAQSDFHFIASQLLANVQPNDADNEQIVHDTTYENVSEIQPPPIGQSGSMQPKQPDGNPTGGSEAVHSETTNEMETTPTQSSEPAQNNEFRPMYLLTYEDHMRILDPVYSLRPIEYVDEQILHEVIVCITETMSRAQELQAIVPMEVPRSIIAYVHGLLDVTSQAMIAWRFNEAEPTLDLLIDFLQSRTNHILPIERAPPAGRAESVAGPSVAKRPKKQPMCPLCKGAHPLIRCTQFRAEPMGNRRRMVAQLNLCENCLYSNHAVATCGHGSCKKCGTKHNSMLLCPPSGAEGGHRN